MASLSLASNALAAEPGGAAAHLPRGTPAPRVSWERLGGGELALTSLAGRVVLLDFWASWCPPCRAELPWLVALAKRYEARGVVLVAVNRDDGAAQRSLATAVSEEVRGLARSVCLGSQAQADLFRVDGLPTMYVLDRQGRVFASAEGRLDEAAVTAVLERALAL